MASTKHWKCTFARDAVYVIQYFMPNLVVKQVVITNQKANIIRYSKGTKFGSVPRIPGEFGLFIHFNDGPLPRHDINHIAYYQKRKKRLKKPYSPRLPVFTNGWSAHLVIEDALLRFFKAQHVFSYIKSHFNLNMASNVRIDNLAKEISTLCNFCS